MLFKYASIPPFLVRLAAALGRVAELDARSLALMRIGLGLVIVSDLVVALTNAEAFYSDAGTLPRTLLYERGWQHAWCWSLHALSGSLQWQWFLILLGMASGVCFTLGWRTRAATLVCWVLTCSLETRNPMIVNGADPVIRLLLFWGLFLPLGRVWSLDVRYGKGGPGGYSVQCPPCFCLLVQIGSVYFYSALLKTDVAWNKDAVALWQVLQADVFTRPLGVWLRLFPLICEWLTRGTMVLERWGPFLVFIPFWRPLWRLLAVAAFWSFHAGIELTMDIGSFPAVMIAAWSAVIPGALWDLLGLGGKLSTAREPSFRWLRDGWCALCLAYVTLWNLRTTDFPRWEKILPRQTNGFGFVLRLDQFWSMFAPYPWLDDGWLVFAAKLTDGSEVDLLNNGMPPTPAKPQLCSARYKDSRWQKYLTNLWASEQRIHREYLTRYLIEKWNTSHGALSQVDSWELVYMLERTHKDGKGIDRPSKQILAFSPRVSPPPTGNEKPADLPASGSTDSKK